MSGYYKDTRLARKAPVIRCTYINEASPRRSVYDKALNVFQYHNSATEQIQTFPGYQDSVRSFRTNRTSSNIDRAGGIFDDVPIVEELSGSVKADSGHEFNSVQHQIVPWDMWRQREVQFYVGKDLRRYIGPLLHHSGADAGLGLGSQKQDSGSLWGPKIPDLDPSWGTRAIAQCAPTKSNANIATSLIELRDGLPKLPGRALKNARGFTDLTKVGPEEFLNYVFGLAPTLGDIRSIASAIVNQKKILDQYQRDNDKVVRRRYGFPVQRSVENWNENYVPYSRLRLLPYNLDDFGEVDTMNNSVFGSSGRASRTLSIQNRIWFSGAFRYHLASTDSQWGRIERTSQLMAKLLGARLDAESLWAAMPWSWLVDWFADVGDIVSNASHAILDGQLLQYGYVMCHTTQHNTVTSHDVRLSNSAKPPTRDITTAFISQRKQRVKATPYGFGLNPDSFSAQQWAILGALGMTKGPKSLF